MVRKRIRLKTEELRIINAILKELIKHKDPEKVFDLILRTFYSFWNIEHSFIALYDPQIGRLKVKNAFGLLPSEIEKAIYSKGEGITGKTYQLGIPLFATEDELLNKTGLVKRVPHKDLGFFTAPIKGGSEILGVIGIFKDLSNSPISIEKTLETLSIIGSILGTFLYLKENKEPVEATDLPLLQEKEITKHGLIGVSKSLERLKQLINKLGSTDLNLLVVGREGTGKTLVAQIIHLTSLRKDKPLHIVDLRNISPALVDIELFGSAGDSNRPPKKGLLELSNGGTLIIKHIELLPIETQKRLLDFVKYKTFSRVGGEKQLKADVRIIATTGRNLLELVEEGKFLSGLYETLSLITVYVPSLQQRREDIPLLVEHFLQKYNRRYQKSIEIEPEVVKFLTNADLKENVKELDRLIHRLVILSREKITMEDLEIVAPYLFKEKRKSVLLPGENLPLPKLLEEEEKQKIIRALEQANYVKSKAAKLLGYTLRQLDYRIKKYRIEVKKGPNR